MLSETLLNPALNCFPSTKRTVMITPAIAPMIRPYSTAVAPCSSFHSFVTLFKIGSRSQAVAERLLLEHLRHVLRDVVELGAHLASERDDDGDDHAGNGCHDQAVLDGRRTLFVLPELLQVLQHGDLLGQCEDARFHSSVGRVAGHTDFLFCEGCKNPIDAAPGTLRRPAQFWAPSVDPQTPTAHRRKDSSRLRRSRWTASITLSMNPPNRF